jgi:hypothetical protein
MIFEGENPPAGAILDFWAARGGETASFTVLNSAGTQVASMEHETVRGMNRVVWDLRHSRPGGEPGGGGGGGGFGGFGGGSRGPLVIPGSYTVRLNAAGTSSEQTVVVLEDPRLEHSVGVRAAWTATLLEVWDAVGEAQTLNRAVGEQADRLDAATDVLSVNDALEAELRDMRRQTQELNSRMGRLYGSLGSWVGPLAADQAAQRDFLTGMLRTLESDWADLLGRLPG